MNGNNLKLSDSPAWRSPLKWRSYIFAYLKINKLDQCCQLGMFCFFLNRYFLRNTTMEVQAKGSGEGLGCAVTIQGGAWVAVLASFVWQAGEAAASSSLFVWVETFLWGRQIFPSLESFSEPRLAPPGMDFHFPLGNRFKVHTVCGKGMSAGWVKRKDATRGRKKGKWAKGSSV